MAAVPSHHVVCLCYMSEPTLDMCTPKRRWAPEQSMHMRIPRFKEAHVGSGAPQSAQMWLPVTCTGDTHGTSAEQGHNNHQADHQQCQLLISHIQCIDAYLQGGQAPEQASYAC